MSPASEARLGDAQVQFPENAHKDVDSENDATRSLGTLCFLESHDFGSSFSGVTLLLEEQSHFFLYGLILTTMYKQHACGTVNSVSDYIVKHNKCLCM